MSKRRVHYVLSTHWDREWHQPFQDFRYLLARLLDQVMAGLESGSLRGPFQTDGQSIVVEDYLEVRPERRGQVEEFVRQGRLVVGPWYTIPDEFIVSGEALVRNLRLGRRLVRSLGGQPSNAGFINDTFGHNSQTPQILAGFGIPGGFLWRGTNEVGTRLLRWRGADGTEMPFFRFAQFGYFDYSVNVRRVRQHELAFDLEEVGKHLRAYIQREAGCTEVDPILLFDGGDHQEWDQEAYAVVAEHLGRDQEGFDLVHTSLDTYLEEMVPQAQRIGTQVEGELREPGRYFDDTQVMIPGVLSSRVWIKQANAECQTLLCHWAEPSSALAHLTLGAEVPEGFLEVAWKWLLKNHAHDSICGCSIDAVHEDMKFRFSQTRRIGERLTLEATRGLAAAAAGELASDELSVTVFNPLPRPLDQSVELTLEIPPDWPQFNEFFGFEPKPGFRLYAPDGGEIPYQRLAQRMRRSKVRLFPSQYRQKYETHEVDVSLLLSLPALGYTTLRVRADRSRTATRHPAVPGLADSERSMSNEHLQVAIADNGSMTLTDRRTGHVYERLLTYEDSADIGDGWYHGQAVNDQAFLSTASSAAVALVHDGPYRTTFRVRTTMQVPAEFHFDDSMRRSERLVELAIDSFLTLRPGVPRVEVETLVENGADDHRLRVLFPTGTRAPTYLADTPFDVVERPVALRPDNHLYRELEVETRPQQSWSAVYAGDRGLALISSGQLETAVRDFDERILALTLFRGTRLTVWTDGEPEGQLRGPLHFRYWIAPLQGEPDRAVMCSLGQQLAAGVRSVQLDPVDLGIYRAGTADLPAEARFLQVEGPAVLTSMRHVEGGLEVRLFNPLATEVEAVLGMSSLLSFTRVQPVNLESLPTGEEGALVDGEAAITLGPKQIVTLRLS